MAYGILLIRIVVGIVFMGHGSQKLFGWFSGPGLRGTANGFGQLGYRSPERMAILAGLAELGGGTLFALGFVFPAAAAALTIVMLNAIATVHWRNGFWNGNGGYEFNLTLISVAVGLAAAGAGRFSLDRALGWDDNISGLGWGAGVLVAAIVVALVTTTVGRARPSLTEIST